MAIISEPDGDRTTEWTVSGSGTGHWDRVADGIEQPGVPDTSNGVYEDGVSEVIDSYTMENVDILGGQADDITIRVYASIETGQNLYISLWNSTETVQYGSEQSIPGNNDTWQWESTTFTGVNLTQAQINGLVVRIRAWNGA